MTTIAALGGTIIGCVSCNAELREAILEHRFLLLLQTIAPITLAGGFVAGWLARSVVRLTRPGQAPVQTKQLKGTAWAGGVIGAGSGGLFDNILLHQILQTHDMISNSLPPVTFMTTSVNVFWSGIFDLSVFALILIGVSSLRAAGQGLSVPRAGFFWGSFLLGWGFFNCFDVLVFHALLRYHDIIEVSAVPFLLNVGWWILGVVIAITGFLLMRNPQTSSDASEPCRNVSQ